MKLKEEYTRTDPGTRVLKDFLPNCWVLKHYRLSTSFRDAGHCSTLNLLLLLESHSPYGCLQPGNRVFYGYSSYSSRPPPLGFLFLLLLFLFIFCSVGSRPAHVRLILPFGCARWDAASVEGLIYLSKQFLLYLIPWNADIHLFALKKNSILIYYSNSFSHLTRGRGKKQENKLGKEWCRGQVWRVRSKILVRVIQAKKKKEK